MDIDSEFEKDAGERLVAMHPGKPWFNKAARLAGQQLEWLIPVAMGDGRAGGFYAGPAVMANPGTVVIVCSNENKLCTVRNASTPANIPCFQLCLRHRRCR